MPSVPSQKIGQPVIFSNPAKLSRAFLAWLGKVPGTLVFVHQQFQYERTRQKVIQALGKERVQFICPSSHREALQVLGRFEWMIDTFPYSSGLTAREAVAMGVKVKVFAGELFCERHSMHLSAK
jgi:predicted O-linked N-acetylglucosamine transferase (SPINDLY family)